MKQAEITTQIQEKLFAMQDVSYRVFHSRLMPTVAPETVIGVRTPLLRSFAKEMSRLPDSKLFLEALPHRYYEENNLHAFLIEQIKDFDACIRALDSFLPYVDNWATCDMMRPKCFRKNKEKLLVYIKRWIASEHTYTIRFAMEMLMCLYLDEDFKPLYLDMVAGVINTQYYVQMMQAWFFATALAKQYSSALSYLEDKRLSSWVHNKTIQKAIESNRISCAQKDHLRTLKREGSALLRPSKQR